MIIRNHYSLATNPLRVAALDMIEAGLHALQSETIMHESVTLHGSTLNVKNHSIDLSRFNRIIVVGIGKASVGMGKALEKILGEKITAGYILDRKKGHFHQLHSLVGTHPDPSEQNVEATKEILDSVTGLDAKTLVLVLISGGGSALLTAPYKISVQEKAAIAKELMHKGATIHEMNVIRKHLSTIKGGQLVKLAYPATVVSLILSDVPGNDLATIASGPTVPDPSTVQDAKRVAKKYKLPNVEFTETPKDDKYFERVTNILLASASSAFPAMEKAGKTHGFDVKFISDHLTGDANEVGRAMLKKVRPQVALVAAGETTVTVTGNGAGGRNQQLVLAALPAIKAGRLVASVGTDGHDNTNSAGAIGDEETVQKAQLKRLDLEQYRQKNDSYTFFQLVGDAIITGELESNFADIMLCLSKKS